MKKVAMTLMLCLLACVMAGCAASPADTNTPAATPEPPAVDLDLSKLSGTVVYAQVYNLMVDYERIDKNPLQK